MLGANNMQLLQAERCVVCVTQNEACATPLRAVNALIQLQDVVRPQIDRRVPRIGMLTAVARHDLKFQAARLDLAVMAVSDG